MKNHIILAILILSLQTGNAQFLHQSSFSIGLTWVSLLDNQWAMIPHSPRVAYRRYGLNLPMLAYRYSFKNSSYLTVKALGMKREKPESYYNLDSPHTLRRRIMQSQITYGKGIHFKGSYLGSSVGIAYQSQYKEQFLARALHFNGWYEVIGMAGKKTTVGVPVELTFQKAIYKQLFVGVSADYTYSFSDFKYYQSRKWDKPDKHLLFLSMSLGFTFGKQL
jgi:hypothetical protein